MIRRDPLTDPEPLIKRVHAYVAYRMGDGAEAEDVTSATFERAIRYRNSYDPAKGDAVSWLFGIARRCVNEALVERSLQGGELPEQQDPADMAGDTLRRIDLRDAIEQLEVRERELLALRYGSDLSTRQIAELMDTTPGSVDVALSRARARLKVVLEGGDLPPVESLRAAKQQPEGRRRLRLRASR
jgi:RNA polymerase sigma-70 factor (ECF subfamily)